MKKILNVSGTDLISLVYHELHIFCSKDGNVCLTILTDIESNNINEVFLAVEKLRPELFDGFSFDIPANEVRIQLCNVEKFSIFIDD